MQKYAYKILRATAPLLAIIIIITLFSGLTLVKSSLSNSPAIFNLALTWHTKILPIISVPLIYLHSLSGLLVMTSRYPKLNKQSIQIAIIVFWTGIFGALGLIAIIAK